MNRLLLLGGVFAVWALALAGCGTRATDLKAKGTLPIALSAEKKSTAVTAELLDSITITLPAPTAADYHWQISFHDARFLKQTTELLPATAAGAGPTVSFIARIPGRTRLRFVLVPQSATRVADPVDQQELVLTIE